ncbi:MAG: cbb3-type cytochrome c oxidase N-terminal domain-containing protein [Flavobacterium sp.]
MKKFFPAYLRVLVVFFSAFGALEYFIDSGDGPAFIKFPMVALFLFAFLFLIIAIELIMAAIQNIGFQIMNDEQKRQFEEAENLAITEREWYKNLMKSLTKSEPIENEALLLLDHDYDGIRELDNKLPPWWLYLFYGGIIFGAMYFVRYEIMDGDDQETEFQKEMAQAKIDVAKYMLTAPDRMDENKVTKLTDASSITIGKGLFMNNCVACHRADAGGQIGPNLTDNHWLFGGDIKNLFHTITNGGRDGKGMVAWKGTLKPTEIQQVASYVLSLRGSNPKDPKAPDGDVWVDPAAATDIPAEAKK